MRVNRSELECGGAASEELLGLAYAVVCDCEGEELARDASGRVASCWRDDDAAYAPHSH